MLPGSRVGEHTNTHTRALTFSLIRTWMDFNDFANGVKCHAEQTLFIHGRRIHLFRSPRCDVPFVTHLLCDLLSVQHCHVQTNNHNNFLSTSHFHAPHERHIEWENIVIPQMYQPYNQQIHPYQHNVQTATPTQTNNHNSRHRMSYLIKSLTPASNYEARVQARNDHGWNKLSSTFHFSTRAEGKSIFNGFFFPHFWNEFRQFFVSSSLVLNYIRYDTRHFKLNFVKLFYWILFFENFQWTFLFLFWALLYGVGVWPGCFIWTI